MTDVYITNNVTQFAIRHICDMTVSTKKNIMTTATYDCVFGWYSDWMLWYLHKVYTSAINLINNYIQVYYD